MFPFALGLPVARMYPAVAKAPNPPSGRSQSRPGGPDSERPALPPPEPVIRQTTAIRSMLWGWP